MKDQSMTCPHQLMTGIQTPGSDIFVEFLRYCYYVNYVSIVCQHKTYANGLTNCNPNCPMELQCGCCIDEIGGILLVECKPHREGKFRN